MSSLLPVGNVVRVLIGAALAGPVNAPGFVPHIDEPLDGEVVDLDEVDVVPLRGWVDAGGRSTADLTCSWYVDGFQVYSGPFTDAGKCAWDLSSADISPELHTARMQAERRSTGQRASFTVSFSGRRGPHAYGHNTSTCASGDGLLALDGRVTGTLGEEVSVTLHLWDDDGAEQAIVDEAADAVDHDAHQGITKAYTIDCVPSRTSACDDSMAFDFSIPPETAATHWTWTLEATDTTGHSSVFPDPDAEPQPLQDFRIVPTPAVTFWEAASAGSLTRAEWSNDSDYVFYANLVETRQSSYVWDDAAFTATYTDGASSYELGVTCVDASDAVVRGYECTVGTDGLGGDALATYNIEMTSADGCVAIGALALTVGEPGSVDNDRDGLTDDEGDCDDANVDVYPGNASMDVCEDATSSATLDYDCDGQINEDAMDAYDGTDSDGDGFVDVYTPNDDVTEATATGAVTVADGAADFSVSGNLHNDGDVDWYYFRVGADGSGAANVGLTATLSVPCVAGLPVGGWTMEAQVAVEKDGVSGYADPATGGTDGARAAPTSASLTGGCVSATTGLYQLALVGDRRSESELHWWIAVSNDGSSSGWGDPMCADGSDAYTLTVAD